MKTIVFAALLSAVPLAAVAQTVPAPITAALADPDRPAAERARDATRHPGELLAFAGIKPGDKVADFIMGGGYWTRILARTVGPSGKVYAYQPAEFIAYRAAYATDQDAAVKGYANVVPKRESLGVLSFAEPLDAIVTVQNWHDLHLKMVPPGSAATIAAHLLTQLNPGGRVAAGRSCRSRGCRHRRCRHAPPDRAGDRPSRAGEGRLRVRRRAAAAAQRL